MEAVDYAVWSEEGPEEVVCYYILVGERLKFRYRASMISLDVLYRLFEDVQPCGFGFFLGLLLFTSMSYPMIAMEK